MTLVGFRKRDTGAFTGLEAAERQRAAQSVGDEPGGALKGAAGGPGGLVHLAILRGKGRRPGEFPGASEAMVTTTESSEPGGVRKMLKPLVEKRRRDRINRSLEELRLLLLQRTHCQMLKNPKVEKAEILEVAVGYLREMNSAKPQGAELSKDGTLQTCYMMGFQECLLGLAAFIQQAHPSVQSHLLDTLHLYLASKPEPHNQDWGLAAFSPSPSLEESPPRTPEAFGSPLKTLSEPLQNPDPPCSSTGQLGSQRRDTHDSPTTAKRIAPPAAFWRPWP
ncbi:transcription factor HES-7 [Elgaria multicarinata webbii]|uniref:transcription factor HES-7 n=1 Tax=Elgaria multicarinata webbii TaxID=159646 RepID=UPI002FCD625A